MSNIERNTCLYNEKDFLVKNSIFSLTPIRFDIYKDSILVEYYLISSIFDETSNLKNIKPEDLSKVYLKKCFLLEKYDVCFILNDSEFFILAKNLNYTDAKKLEETLFSFKNGTLTTTNHHQHNETLDYKYKNIERSMKNFLLAYPWLILTICFLCLVSTLIIIYYINLP